MIEFRRKIILLFCGFLLSVSAPYAAPQMPVEQIKAAFIYQFTHFVSWPTVADSSELFKLCVFGQGSVGVELGKLEESMGVLVAFPQTIHDVQECKILYITKSMSGHVADILAHVENKSILTVSSVPEFALSGGIIGFVTRNGKIRMEINRAPAKKANIEINAKLLEVASLVLDYSYKGELR